MGTADIHTTTGKKGEKEAKAYLEQKGYQVLHTNWRSGHYELDIVASLPDLLVCIEVKTRSANYLLLPEESINKSKIKRLVAATHAYVWYFHIDLPVRFDVVTLVYEKETCRIEHIENAFYAPLSKR
ncbi:MAG: YraN family protein [Tannerellaceae bacterium]|nr:YraN family protein [Tannerellaceae bacterium]